MTTNEINQKIQHLNEKITPIALKIARCEGCNDVIDAHQTMGQDFLEMVFANKEVRAIMDEIKAFRDSI